MIFPDPSCYDFCGSLAIGRCLDRSGLFVVGLYLRFEVPSLQNFTTDLCGEFEGVTLSFEGWEKSERKKILEMEWCSLLEVQFVLSSNKSPLIGAQS